MNIYITLSSSIIQYIHMYKKKSASRHVCTVPDLVTNYIEPKLQPNHLTPPYIHNPGPNHNHQSSSLIIQIQTLALPCSIRDAEIPKRLALGTKACRRSSPTTRHLLNPHRVRPVCKRLSSLCRITCPTGKRPCHFRIKIPLKTGLIKIACRC